MDKKILQLNIKDKLPEEVYVPASDKDGKMFYFEYCTQTMDKVNSIPAFSKEDAEIMLNGCGIFTSKN